MTWTCWDEFEETHVCPSNHLRNLLKGQISGKDPGRPQKVQFLRHYDDPFVGTLCHILFVINDLFITD